MNFDYSNPTLIGILAAVVLLIFVAVAIAVRHRTEQTRNLRQRFGPEYDRLLQQSASTHDCETRLLARKKRVQLLNFHDLTQAQRTHYLNAWETVQFRFIDHPRGAVIEADELITSLLHARGFPAEGFEQRAADLSVDHPHLVAAYRSGSALTARAGKNDATTEELRSAMIQYRTLVDDLLQIETPMEERQLV